MTLSPSFTIQALKRLNLNSFKTYSRQLSYGFIARHSTLQRNLLPLQSPLNLSFRGYASKKGKKGKTQEKETVEEESLFKLDEYSEKFQRSLDKLDRDLQSLKVGRANPAILDTIQVDCGTHGGVLPIQSVCQVSILDPQNLVVNVFDTKVLKQTENAIREAGLNLNPLVEKGRIRVPVPKLTAEGRDVITKQVTQLSEKAKNALRSTRQDGMKILASLKKNASGLSSDDVRTYEKELQKILEVYQKKVDTTCSIKVKEIKG